MAAPAVAASGHGISGTTYSGCPLAAQPTLYISSNARYKSGTGSITAQFTGIGDNGLGLKLLDVHNATVGQVKFWTKSETDWSQALATGVPNGKRFYNSFRETGTSCLKHSHEFTGSEYY
jgi:hypothetical protein